MHLRSRPAGPLSDTRTKRVRTRGAEEAEALSEYDEDYSPVTLYRGMYLQDPENNLDSLTSTGVHWTTDPGIAKSFGNVVLEAEVNPEHLMDLDEANARYLIGDEAVERGEYPCEHCYQDEGQHRQNKSVSACATCGLTEGDAVSTDEQRKFDTCPATHELAHHDFKPSVEFSAFPEMWQASDEYGEAEHPVRPGSPIRLKAVHVKNGRDWERRDYVRQITARAKEETASLSEYGDEDSEPFFFEKEGMAIKDDALQRVIEEQGPYAFHNTHPANVPSILENGLIPWDEEVERNKSEDWHTGWNAILPRRKQHVYLHTGPSCWSYLVPDDEKVMGFYEGNLSHPVNRHPCPIRIDMRKLDPSKFNVDEGGIESDKQDDASDDVYNSMTDGFAFSYRGTIPPEAIEVNPDLGRCGRCSNDENIDDGIDPDCEWCRGSTKPLSLDRYAPIRQYLKVERKASTKPQAIICDLDGTLASMGHRHELIVDNCRDCLPADDFYRQASPKKNCTTCNGTGIDPVLAKRRKANWEAFFDLAALDAPVPDVLNILRNAHRDGHRIIFATARPDIYRYQTEDWIRERLPWLDDYDLHMKRTTAHRTCGGAGCDDCERGFLPDRRADALVKEEMYREHIEPTYDVRLAIDDHPTVIAKWRELGIATLACFDPDIPPVEKTAGVSDAAWQSRDKRPVQHACAVGDYHDPALRYLTLYRGLDLADIPSDEAIRNWKQLGQHWTDKLEVAKAFGPLVLEARVHIDDIMDDEEANIRFKYGDKAYESGDWPCCRCGVLQSKHPEGKEYSDTFFTNKYDENHIYEAGYPYPHTVHDYSFLEPPSVGGDYYAHESEHPVRPGAPIHLTGVHVGTGLEVNPNGDEKHYFEGTGNWTRRDLFFTHVASSRRTQSVPQTKVKTAAWADVRNKARRIRRSGGVELIRLDDDVIVAKVQGDHQTYEVEIFRQYPNAKSVTFWTCSCRWGEWAFKRQKTYVGRFCSHALATLYEAHSQERRKKVTAKASYGYHVTRGDYRDSIREHGLRQGQWAGSEWPERWYQAFLGPNPRNNMIWDGSTEADIWEINLRAAEKDEDGNIKFPIAPQHLRLLRTYTKGGDNAKEHEIEVEPRPWEGNKTASDWNDWMDDRRNRYDSYNWGAASGIDMDAIQRIRQKHRQCLTCNGPIEAKNYAPFDLHLTQCQDMSHDIQDRLGYKVESGFYIGPEISNAIRGIETRPDEDWSDTLSMLSGLTNHNDFLKGDVPAPSKHGWSNNVSKCADCPDADCAYCRDDGFDLSDGESSCDECDTRAYARQAKDKIASWGIDYAHSWNRLSDGTILDSSADQFGNQESVRVIPFDDPRQGWYQAYDYDRQQGIGYNPLFGRHVWNIEHGIGPVEHRCKTASSDWNDWLDDRRDRYDSYDWGNWKPAEKKEYEFDPLVDERIRKTLDSLSDQYPITKGWLQEPKYESIDLQGKGGAFGCIVGSGHIVFNKDEVFNPKSQIHDGPSSWQREKPWSVGHGIEQLTAHEFAHALHMSITKDALGELPHWEFDNMLDDTYLPIVRPYVNHEDNPVRKIMEEAKANHPTAFVSTYAQRDELENFAEAMLDYWVSPEPEPYSREIGSRIDALYHRNARKTAANIRKVVFNGRRGPAFLDVEVADTPSAIQTGLMYRSFIPMNQGMLFDFKRPTTTGFWMQNVSVPLSIAFIDNMNRIIDIQDMDLCWAGTCPSYSPNKPFVMAIEANQGWFTFNGIGVGDFVSIA